MCVIFVSSTTRPTEDMVSKAFDANSDGAGIAYRLNGEVVWKKGLNEEEIQDEVAKAPFPFISHYRIPSSGGNSRYLNHPFPINEACELKMEGSTKDAVLFHNGTWNSWKSTMLEAAIRSGKKIPVGRWNDSRAMAWLASFHGLGILELIDEKVAVLGQKNLYVFGSGWSVVNGVHVSNRFWENRTAKKRKGSATGEEKVENPPEAGGNKSSQTEEKQTLVTISQRMDEAISTFTGKESTGGSALPITFRPQENPLPCGGGSVCGAKDQQETVEEGSELLETGSEQEQEPAFPPLDSLDPEARDEVESELQVMFASAAALNPKPFKNPDRHGAKVLPFNGGDPDSIRHRRMRAFQKGIEIVGRM